MAEDVTKLVLVVDSKQVGVATKRLNTLIVTSGRAEKSTRRLTSSFVGLGVSLVAVYKAYQALENTIVKVATFEKLNKQLEFLTGSAQGAANELEYLRAVAQENALVTEEMVGPYARMSTAMSQLGLSAESTRDVFEGVAGAAATFGMGADEVNGILVALSQVASKGTVQAEELRNQIGERIPGAFNLAAEAMGVTTKKLNKMLEQGEVMALDFLPKFAEQLEKTFGDDIANKTDTLGAAWRRAGESLTFYQLHLAESAATGFVLKEILTGTSEALNMLSGSSVDAAGDMKDVWYQSDNIRDSLITARIVAGQFGLGLQAAAKMGEIALLGVTNLLTSVVNNTLIGVITGIEKVVNSATSKIQSLIDTALQASGFLSDELEEKLKGVRDSLNFKLDIDTSGLKNGTEATAAALWEAIAELDELSKKMTTYPEDVLKSLGDATLKSSETLRKTLDEFATSLENGTTTDEDAIAKAQLEAMSTRFDQLVESLRTEEEAIEASYEARKKLILDYSNATGTEQTELMARLEEDRENQRKAIQQKQWSTALSSFDDFQNNMLVLAKVGNNEIATVYKAAAIANTTIKTYESATSAYAALAGIPIVGPALGTAAAAAAIAAGMANVSAIANQQVGGYAQGGIIPGNNHNGDNLTAHVNSGEMILNHAQQKNLFDMANNGGGTGNQKPVVVNVIGAPADEVQVNESETSEARIIEIAVRRAKSEISSEIRSGSGDTERALQTRDRRTR